MDYAINFIGKRQNFQEIWKAMEPLTSNSNVLLIVKDFETKPTKFSKFSIKLIEVEANKDFYSNPVVYLIRCSNPADLKLNDNNYTQLLKQIKNVKFAANNVIFVNLIEISGESATKKLNDINDKIRSLLELDQLFVLPYYYNSKEGSICVTQKYLEPYYEAFISKIISIIAKDLSKKINDLNQELTSLNLVKQNSLEKTLAYIQKKMTLLKYLKLTANNQLRFNLLLEEVMSEYEFLKAKGLFSLASIMKSSASNKAFNDNLLDQYSSTGSLHDFGSFETAAFSKIAAIKISYIEYKELIIYDILDTLSDLGDESKMITFLNYVLGKLPQIVSQCFNVRLAEPFYLISFSESFIYSLKQIPQTKISGQTIREMICAVSLFEKKEIRRLMSLLDLRQLDLDSIFDENDYDIQGSSFGCDKLLNNEAIMYFNDMNEESPSNYTQKDELVKLSQRLMSRFLESAFNQSNLNATNFFTTKSKFYCSIILLNDRYSSYLKESGYYHLASKLELENIPYLFALQDYSKVNKVISSNLKLMIGFPCLYQTYNFIRLFVLNFLPKEENYMKFIIGYITNAENFSSIEESKYFSKQLLSSFVSNYFSEFRAPISKPYKFSLNQLFSVDCSISETESSKLNLKLFNHSLLNLSFAKATVTLVDIFTSKEYILKVFEADEGNKLIVNEEDNAELNVSIQSLVEDSVFEFKVFLLEIELTSSIIGFIDEQINSRFLTLGKKDFNTSVCIKSIESKIEVVGKTACNSEQNKSQTTNQNFSKLNNSAEITNEIPIAEVSISDEKTRIPNVYFNVLYEVCISILQLESEKSMEDFEAEIFIRSDVVKVVVVQDLMTSSSIVPSNKSDTISLISNYLNPTVRLFVIFESSEFDNSLFSAGIELKLSLKSKIDSRVIQKEVYVLKQNLVHALMLEVKNQVYSQGSLISRLNLTLNANFQSISKLKIESATNENLIFWMRDTSKTLKENPYQAVDFSFLRKKDSIMLGNSSCKELNQSVTVIKIWGAENRLNYFIASPNGNEDCLLYVLPYEPFISKLESFINIIDIQITKDTSTVNQGFELFQEIKLIIKADLSQDVTKLKMTVQESLSWQVIGKTVVIIDLEGTERKTCSIDLILLPLLDGYVEFPLISFSSFNTRGEEYLMNSSNQTLIKGNKRILNIFPLDSFCLLINSMDP